MVSQSHAMDSRSEGKDRDIPMRGSISVPNHKTTCHKERKKTASPARATEGYSHIKGGNRMRWKSG